MGSEIDQLTLKAFPIFEGIDVDRLDKLAKYCEYSDLYKLGDPITVNGNNPTDIMILDKGCVAVQAKPFFSHNDQILALIMPRQLMLEFEYLGNPPPTGLRLYCVAPTRILMIPSEKLNELSQDNPRLMKNIALSVVQKTNVDNFRSEVASQHQGDKKIASFLFGFCHFPEWKPESYKDRDLKAPMEIPIVWSIRFLTKFFSCDERTIRQGLAYLFETELIKISLMSPNEELTPIDLTTKDQIMKTDKKGVSRLIIDASAYFLITALKPGRLRTYVEDD